VTCAGNPPTTLDAFWATIDRCATEAGGADWPSLALTGAATLALLVFAVLLVGAAVGRAR
jgi:hypothetical protein